MSLKNKVALATLTGITALAGYLGYQGLKSNEAERAHYELLARELHVGDKAADFSLLSLQDGRTISLSNLEGKTVLLDFWATWCSPCRALTPDLEKLSQECKEDGLEVIQIATKDKEENVRNYIANKGSPAFPIVYDSSNEIATAYAVKGLPRMVLIKNGIVQGIEEGYGAGTANWFNSIKKNIKKKK